MVKEDKEDIKYLYKDSNNKKSRVFVWISYAYILLPFLIFAIGWFGKRYWVFIAPILVFCYWKACKDTKQFWIPQFNKDNFIKIAFIIFIIFVWVYYSGIGRFVFQNGDHNCRNAVYETLVQYDWPIYNYDVNVEKWGINTTATSLIYYIGFWLPSAVIGKVFGVDAGYGFQAFWAILGIVLIYYFICARKEKLLVWPLAILLFFSGLDIVGQYLVGTDVFALANDAHLEWWVEPYQYSSITTQLYWVYNQSIPAWLCTILAFAQGNNRSIIFILACCMISSTFPFVGLLVLVLYWMFSRRYTEVYAKSFKIRVKQYIYALIKDTFTIQNVLGGGIVGIFSFLYLSANTSSSQLMSESVYGVVYDNHLAKYLMFILVEVGIYFIVIYKYQKHNGLYFVILISLLIIPPIKVGAAGDFCMRVSIPALFILMLMVMDTLEKSKRKKDLLVLISLLVTLVIGGITPIHEVARSFKNTSERLNEKEQVYETAIDSNMLLNSNNFSGDVSNNFFYKYIAR